MFFFDDTDDDFMESLGRTRRPVPDEWDDYVVLYADIRVAFLMGDLPAEKEEPVHACPVCEYVSPTLRGLTVHLSRTHDIKSARADYFASRHNSKES